MFMNTDQAQKASPPQSHSPDLTGGKIGLYKKIMEQEW
jgi:hypothetical protein